LNLCSRLSGEVSGSDQAGVKSTISEV
jgi:hypothetical protein